MVGDHFSYEVGGDAVGGAGVFHLTKHGFFDLIDSGLVTAQIFLAVVDVGAVVQDFLHLCDSFGLLGDDLQGDVLKGNIRGVS